MPIDKNKYFDLIKIILILATVWYGMVFVLPNFYSKSEDSVEYKKLQSQIDELTGEIRIYKSIGDFILKKMNEEPVYRHEVIKNRTQRIKEYKNKPEDEKVKLFNNYLEKLRKQQFEN